MKKIIFIITIVITIMSLKSCKRKIIKIVGDHYSDNINSSVNKKKNIFICEYNLLDSINKKIKIDEIFLEYKHSIVNYEGRLEVDTNNYQLIIKFREKLSKIDYGKGWYINSFIDRLPRCLIKDYNYIPRDSLNFDFYYGNKKNVIKIIRKEK